MQITLIVIRTDKPKELSKFYEILGMNFNYHRHGKGPWHYSAQIGKTVLEIYPLLKNQESPDISLRLGFSIESLDEIIGKLQKINAEIIQEPKISEWGYVAIIKDLDGRKIELKRN